MHRELLLAGCLLTIVPACAAQMPSAPAPSTPERATPPAPPPAHTEQMTPDRAEGILGAVVAGPDGKDIGRIVDVLVDRQGKPRAAVIDFGGFFGVGSRKVAVSWTNLNFAPSAKQGGAISLDLTADQIKAAPEYHPASAAAVVTARKPATPPATPPSASGGGKE